MPYSDIKTAIGSFKFKIISTNKVFSLKKLLSQFPLAIELPMHSERGGNIVFANMETTILETVKGEQT